MENITNPNNDGNLYFTTTGEQDGKPFIFRIRSKIPNNTIETDYPHLLTISWPYDSNDSGMPDEETNDSHITFEDALEDLDQPDIGFLMLIITGNNRKEWNWYVKDIDNWLQKLNAALQGHPVFPIEIEPLHQPDWSVYHDFISWAEER